MNRIRVLCSAALAGIVLVSFGAGSAAAAPVTTVIDSNTADGSVYRYAAGNTGASSANTQINGSAAGPANYNGVTLYALPDQRSGVVAASLDFLITTGGSIPANVDLWGLGYIHGAAALVGNWEFHDLSDTRVLLNGVTPTSIADNIVAANATVTTGTHLVTSGAQNVALVNYLNALYTTGAVAGDFVVFRTNPDVDVLNITGTSFKNIRFGTGSDAKLSVTTVPEPATLSLLAVASLAMIRRRR